MEIPIYRILVPLYFGAIPTMPNRSSGALGHLLYLVVNETERWIFQTPKFIDFEVVRI
jgi:hypothetical protein